MQIFEYGFAMTRICTDLFHKTGNMNIKNRNFSNGEKKGQHKYSHKIT